MKRLLSGLLAICLVASFFVGVAPQVAQAAGEIYITDAAMLRDKLAEGTETTFVLAADLTLDETIVIPVGRTIVIRGAAGTRPTIRPQNASWPLAAPLIQISAGATVTLENLALNGGTDSGNDAEKRARGIVVNEGGANVTLNSVTISACDAVNQNGGALCATGASAGNPGKLNLSECVFMDNETSTTIPTSGGAIYVGSNYTVKMEQTSFSRNKAHSGGALCPGKQKPTMA